MKIWKLIILIFMLSYVVRGQEFIVIDQERGNAEYTIKVEVIYWE